MESASPQSGQWFLGATYQYHDISDLVAGSDSIPDATGRERRSNALIAEISRGISEKWSASLLLSATEHNREVNDNTASASGLGDALLMIKFAPQSISLYSDYTLSFGLGVRIPAGQDDATRRGVVLAEDMQPSTGAYGAIAWGYWARALNDSRATRVYVSTSLTLNAENDRDYQFGDEWTVSVGASHQTQRPWGFNLELLYRNADRDQRNAVEIPNTGGEWLDVIPAVQYHLSEDLAVRASAQLPLARDLHDEVQFTSKVAYRLSLSYVFGGS